MLVFHWRSNTYVPMYAKTHPVTAVIMVVLKIKITVLTCLVSSGGWDSFPKQQKLALAPKKTNGEVKKQWKTRQHDKSRRIITCLVGFRLYRFSLACWSLRAEKERMWGSWQLPTLSTLLMDPKLDCQKLRHCLGEFFCCWQWQIINHQHYLPKSPRNMYSWIACQLDAGIPIITFAVEVQFQIRGRFWIPQPKLLTRGNVLHFFGKT